MSCYTEAEARALVIEAGHKLLQSELVARTWGNISARISDTEFVITPSGRAYETLTPADLVKVRIDDLSYTGDIKPSSEKGIHADAYAMRPDVNFVIHTHQLYASAIGVEDQDMPFAPCAHYGLPGTEKLRRAVWNAIAANPTSRSFLMAKHGALCLGGSFDDAFRLAQELEENCKAAFFQRVGIRQAEQIVPAHCLRRHLLRAYIDDYAQLVGACAPIHNGTVQTPESDDADALRLIVRKNCAAALYARRAKPLSYPDALLQRMIYLTKYSKQKNA